MLEGLGRSLGEWKAELTLLGYEGGAWGQWRLESWDAVGQLSLPADRVYAVSRRTQAVRIQESRYRHPACYVCADCGLNLKMRGHFWVGEELYCEKHARQRYQGPGEGAAAAATGVSSKS